MLFNLSSKKKSTRHRLDVITIYRNAVRPQFNPFGVPHAFVFTGHDDKDPDWGAESKFLSFEEIGQVLGGN